MLHLYTCKVAFNKNMDKMTFLSRPLIALYLLVYFYVLHIVKSCEGSEILAHFQANKLVYYDLTCWQIKYDS